MIAQVAVRNALWFSIGSYVIQAISFIATLLLTRWLGPTVFGVFAMASFWVSLLSLEPKSGMYFSAVRNSDLNGKLLGTYFGLQLGFNVLSLLIGVVAAFILTLTGYVTDTAVAIIILLSLATISTFTNPLAMAIEKELQLSRQTLVGVISALLGYGLALLLAHFGVQLWSILSISVVSTVVGMIGTVIVCRNRLPAVMRMRWQFDAKLARQLVFQGLPIGLSNTITATFVSQFDNFLIGTFESAATLGYYDRAFRLSQWPNTLLTHPITKLAFLTFAQVKDDKGRLTEAIRLMLWLLTLLAPPIALFLALGAPYIIEILLTSAWAQSAYFLQFLALYSLLTPFIAIATSLGAALGYRRFIVFLTSLQAAILIVVGLLLTLWKGATGTVLAVGCMNVVGFVLGIRYIRQMVPLSIRSIFLNPAIALSASIVLTYAAHMLLKPYQPSALLSLAITALTAPCVYIFLLFLLNPRELLTRTRYLIAKFRGPRGSPIV